MKTILLAVSGMSPAIITETVWALACESPPTVPDEVVIVTTLRGEGDIARMLLAPLPEWKGLSVWETLRRDVFKKAKLPSGSAKLQLSVRVIDLPGKSGVREKAEDIRTREENDQAADFILNTLFPYATAEDCRVIASIAGGRKTMGALLYGAMTLLAKETDRLTHVLVNEPFEMCRGFFYPAQPVKTLEAGPFGKTVPVHPKDARVGLADISFVPLRNGFAELGQGSMGFHGLVARYSKELATAPKTRPSIHLDSREGIFTVNGTPIRLTGRELLCAMFLETRAKAGKPRYQSIAAAQPAFEKFAGEFRKNLPRHRAVIGFEGGIPPTTLTQGLSGLRKKLTQRGLAHTIPHLAPVRGAVGFDAEFPVSGA